jgi:hypothetical protein
VVLVAVSVCLAIVLCQDVGLALDPGHPKYQFQSRRGPDREEGIKPLERSGAYIDLVGAFLQVPGLSAGGEPAESFQLGFYLREREPLVRIRVRDYDRFEKFHYWMVPARTAFESGFQQFAWDASVARELGIRADHLGAVARLGGRGHELVVPLLLAAGPLPAAIRAQGVLFLFVPNETVTVDYRVYEKGSPSRALLHVTGERWPKGQRSGVRWAGRGPDGQPAGEGVYELALTASVKTALGLTESIPYDYTFHYRPEVAVRR